MFFSRCCIVENYQKVSQTREYDYGDFDSDFDGDSKVSKLTSEYCIFSRSRTSNVKVEMSTISIFSPESQGISTKDKEGRKLRKL